MCGAGAALPFKTWHVLVDDDHRERLEHTLTRVNTHQAAPARLLCSNHLAIVPWRLSLILPCLIPDGRLSMVAIGLRVTEVMARGGLTQGHRAFNTVVYLLPRWKVSFTARLLTFHRQVVRVHCPPYGNELDELTPTIGSYARFWESVPQP